LVTAGAESDEFGLLGGVLEARIELVDRALAAAHIRSDRIFDGGVRGVQRHDVVGGTRGEGLEIAVDGLRDRFLGRHDFGRYIVGCTTILAACLSSNASLPARSIGTGG